MLHRAVTKSRKQPPVSWKVDYPLIKQLRALGDAPVDSIGCDRLADRKAARRDFEWQCLVAAMLSSQTKDQATAEAMSNLRAYGNSISSISCTPERKLDRMIAKVGFHATKAKSLKAAAKICRDKHKGRVPSQLEDLLALPGVGPKMAHLTMHAAFGKQDGLCVDTHVHRIANALGWVKTKTAEDTRVAIERWLPRKHWPEINIMLVGLGQLQQQDPHRLIARCLTNPPKAAALRLLARIGLHLRGDRFPDLAEAARRAPAIRRLLVA